MMIAAAMTENALAIPTAVITLSSENTISSSPICDNSSKGALSGPRRLVRPVVLEALMDLPRALVEQKEAAPDQHNVAPGDGMPEEIEHRAGQAHDPGDRSQQRQPADQSDRQTNLPCPVLLLWRQPRGQNREKDEIVDPEHNLERRQGYETRPDLGIAQPLEDHVASLRLAGCPAPSVSHHRPI